MNDLGSTDDSLISYVLFAAKLSITKCNIFSARNVGHKEQNDGNLSAAFANPHQLRVDGEEHWEPLTEWVK